MDLRSENQKRLDGFKEWSQRNNNPTIRNSLMIVEMIKMIEELISKPTPPEPVPPPVPEPATEPEPAPEPERATEPEPEEAPKPKSKPKRRYSTKRSK
ncbi:MAG: hypothetical protein R6U98_06605 [Pirellulaceae bacterium]